jgi:hypothetical protein
LFYFVDTNIRLFLELCNTFQDYFCKNIKFFIVENQTLTNIHTKKTPKNTQNWAFFGIFSVEIFREFSENHTKVAKIRCKHLAQIVASNPSSQ